jgi:probable rRNA maturation factor
MNVEVRSSLRALSYPAIRTRRFLNRALRLAGHRAGDVSVFFCGDSVMRRLNRLYRRKDRTTDVLSFPSGISGEFLGDLVISVPEARRQARREGKREAALLERLLLHGLLHLLGYDHETDDGMMNRLEGRLRRRMSIPS